MTRSLWKKALPLYANSITNKLMLKLAPFGRHQLPEQKKQVFDLNHGEFIPRYNSCTIVRQLLSHIFYNFYSWLSSMLRWRASLLSERISHSSVACILHKLTGDMIRPLQHNSMWALLDNCIAFTESSSQDHILVDQSMFFNQFLVFLACTEGARTTKAQMATTLDYE